MSSHPPPLPPAQRPKRPVPNAERSDAARSTEKGPPPGNPDQQGQGAGVAQNTHNKGHQQDR